MATTHGINLATINQSNLVASKFTSISDGYLNFNMKARSFTASSAEGIVNSVNPNNIVWLDTAISNAAFNTIEYVNDGEISLASTSILDPVNLGEVEWRAKIGHLTTFGEHDLNTFEVTDDGIYVCGYVNSDIAPYNSKARTEMWGNHTPTDIPTIQSTKTMYIIKYDHLGQIIWRTKAGGALTAITKSMHIAGDGVYMVGYSDVSGGINTEFYNAVPGTTAWGSPPAADMPHFSDIIFIVKYSLDTGEILWRTQLTINGDKRLHARVADNNLYLFGNLETSVSIYPVITGVEPWFNGPTADITSNQAAFILKLNPDGSLSWRTKFYSAIGTNDAQYIHVSDGVYVAGMAAQNTWMPEVIFGNDPWPLMETDIAGITIVDNSLYVIKFDTDGNLIWRTLISGVSAIADVDIYYADALYISGKYDSFVDAYDAVSGILTWGTPDAISSTMNSNGVFLIKYGKNNGGVIWRSMIETAAQLYKPMQLKIFGSDMYVSIPASTSAKIYNTVHGRDFWDNIDSVYITIYDNPTYIIKFDVDGTLLWRTAISNSHVKSINVAADGLFVCISSDSEFSSFYKPVLGYGQWVGATYPTIANTGLSNYLSKYDTDGNLVWRNIMRNNGVMGVLDTSSQFAIYNGDIFVAAMIEQDINIYDTLRAKVEWGNTNSVDTAYVDGEYKNMIIYKLSNVKYYTLPDPDRQKTKEIYSANESVILAPNFYNPDISSIYMPQHSALTLVPIGGKWGVMSHNNVVIH